MKKLDLNRLKDTFKNGVKNTDSEDATKLLSRQEEVEEKFKANGKLSRIIEDVKLLFSLLKDYYQGVYRDIPWGSVAAIIFALLYVLTPFDLMPDFIPILGYTDDAMVLSLCWTAIATDLQNYNMWKTSPGQLSVVEHL